MNTSVQNKLTKLENSRLSLIESLKNIPNATLEMPPQPESWSVSQLFYHLNKAESLSIQYVSKKRLDINNLKKTGFKEQFNVIILKIRFLLPNKIKSPPAVLGDMPANVPYNSIIKDWDITRKNLNDLIASLPDDLLHKAVFKQPALGMLNIFQMLDFMQAHFNRHKLQVEKIVKFKSI